VYSVQGSQALQEIQLLARKPEQCFTVYFSINLFPVFVQCESKQTRICSKEMSHIDAEPDDTLVF